MLPPLAHSTFVLLVIMLLKFLRNEEKRPHSHTNKTEWGRRRGA